MKFDSKNGRVVFWLKWMFINVVKNEREQSVSTCFPEIGPAALAALLQHVWNGEIGNTCYFKKIVAVVRRRIQKFGACQSQARVKCCLIVLQAPKGRVLPCFPRQPQQLSEPRDIGFCSLFYFYSLFYILFTVTCKCCQGSVLYISAVWLNWS